MADELGGLFDSDPGFLEELASGSRGNPGPGMIGQQGGVPPTAMIGQPGIPTQNIARMNQMQSQQQGFGTNMGGQFPPQQQQMNAGQFNQFSNQPMGQQMQMIPGQGQGTPQGHVGQMMSPHRNPQFAQAQQGMVLQQPQGQVQVNMARAPGPRLPTPQQQMMMGQGQGQMQNWNVQMYAPGQQPQPQGQGQTQYLSHHDYAVPSSNGGNTNYQNQMMGNQATFVQQQMTTPAGQPQANRMPIRQTMYANQRMPFSKNFPNSQQVMTSMNSSQMMVQQQQQQQQILQQHNQQPGNVMQMQQFRMSANPQIQQQGIINSPQQNIVRFSQTSPNQGSVQHRLPFTSMPQQRQTVPMLSPRPTPPPPSPSGSQGVLSPTGSTSSNIVQNVGMTSGNSGNLFNQGANSDMSLNDMTPQKQFTVQGPSPQMMSPPSGGSTNNLSQITSPNPSAGQVNMNVSATVNSSSNNFSNGPNQVSPTHKVLSPNMNSPPQNVQIEVQTLTQQIQQLYNMPQTQDTQQKLLDLQERLRSVKSQHMLAAQRQGQPLQAGSQQQQIMTSLPNMTQQTGPTSQMVQQQGGVEQQQAAQQMQNQTVQQQQKLGLQQEQQQNVGLQPQTQQIDEQQQQQQQNIVIQKSQQQQQQQKLQNMNMPGQQVQIQTANAVVQSVQNVVQQPGNVQLVAGGPIQQQPGMIRQPGGGQPGQPNIAFKINTQPGQRIQLVRGPAQVGGGQQKIFILQQQQQGSPQQQQQPPSSVPVSGSLVQPVNISQPVNSTQPLLKTIPQPQHVIINTSLSSGGNTQLGQAQIVQGQTLQGGQTQILPNIPGVRPQRMPVPMQVQIPQQMVPVSQNVQNTIPQPQLMQNTQMMGNSQVMGPVPPGMQHSPVPVQLQQGMQHSPVPLPVQIVRENEQEGIVSVSQQQEKANKIIAEAIAKAQRTGSSIPKVMSPGELPSTLTEVELPDSTSTPTDTPTKVKRKRKPREPKKDKSPKKKREKVKVIATDELSNVDIENSMTEDGEADEFKEKKQKKKREPGEKKLKGEKTPKFGGKKRSKPPATFLKSKKRKRRGSSDGSDMEIKFTPPPSPLDDDLKRRSGRHTKRKKYNDELDLELSDEDTMDAPPGETEGAVVKPVQLFVDNPAEEDAVVVEKILGSRMRTKDADVSNDEDEEDDVEEYYVKYKNFSYLHCEWKTEKELMKDKRIPGKIRRYKIKKAQNNFFSAEDEELFNPDYVEVDRVLEESVTFDPNSKEEITHYLVKWRGLAYEDSTWELQQDVDPEKVLLFKKFRELPDEEDRQFVCRPSSGSDWKALAKTHQYKNGNTLREYQLEGVNWLTFSWYKRQNCILADEMGLGKTIQSITFLQEIFNYGIQGPFLVIAPLSTIGNWMREFELWTDMNVIVYHGTSPSRFMLQEYEMYYKDEKGRKVREFYKFQVIITTYELIISDLEVLRDINWRCVIIDEAHRLKNKNCRLMEGLRFFDFEHKVLLSGTPLQNNVEELFSLLNFLEPSQFHSSTDFLNEFGTLRTEEQVDKLKAILKPMMLRRLKEDVEKNLAAKEETIIEVELTNIQKKYYRAILEKNFSFLHKGTQSSGNVPNLMNTMMELRKCCNHPYLINGAEDNILSDMLMKQQQSTEADPVVQAMIQASGKFVLLDKLLPKLKQSGHKVLIFSQMIRVLDILEDYLVHKRYLYERIDGRITGNLRQEAIDRFSKPDSDRFVFLLCTRAGGLGINLTAADTVIIYDSDWNPQNDLQAQARCHRIGQVRMVKVYRLITRNSYEREMFDRASVKLGLDKAVLQSMGGEKINPQAQLSKREIEELLRKGAYGALMEDDSAGDAFCEEDIDQILQRRTQVVQIESEGKGSTFAKASFSMTGNRDDIDINDPEFWEKWAKKADVNVDAGEKELIIEEPRVRKKTTRYGNDNAGMDISDLDSSSGSDTDSKSAKGRKGRGRRKGDDDTDFESERHVAKSYGPGYGRSELFKVEKGLLVYGWGRWTDIVTHANWKRHMEEKDVEKVSRAILIYSLGHYKGDERIKEFIWDLVSPSGETVLKNHSGLSAPVPRGRKGRKRDEKEVKEKEDPKSFNTEDAIAECKVDPNVVLGDNGYKKHLHRHSNKVLLRVRTLYYLKHEVLGQAAEAIAKGVNVADINIPLPAVDVDPPAYWWDNEADKSLLVGVFKHGYEKYNLMRQDQTLTFLVRCGPPDSAALAKEMKDDDDDDDKVDQTIQDNDDEDESVLSTSDVTTKKPAGEARTPAEGEGEEGEKLPFPGVSDLNTRLRRIITNYQRDYKRQQQKKEQQAKKIEKRGKLDAMVRERELRRRETQQRWVRREETDFYRVVSTYGIEFDRHKGRYIWDKFRQMAKLEKKTEEQLTEYFISFYHMCLRVCRKIKEDAYPPTPLYVEAITEERASRCIARIDLLSKIREEIIVHAKLRERIMLCKTSYDLPSWWINGFHDRELLIGAAKHGLAKTETYILGDPNFSFQKYCKPPEPTSQPNSPANFKLFGKDIGKVKDETDSVKEEKSETKEDSDVVKVENKEDDPATPSNPLDEDDEDTSEYHQEMLETMAKNSQEEEEDKTENEQEEEKDRTENKEEEKDRTENKEEEKDRTENKKEEQETKIKVSDFIKKEVEKLTENVKETEVKKEVVNSDDDEDMKTDVKKERDMDKHSEDKDDKSKQEEEDGGKVSVKREIKTDAREDDEDEEVRRTFEEGESSRTEFLNKVKDGLSTHWPKDRIIFHRLEHICYCIETGEWPFGKKMPNPHILGIDSGSATPTSSRTPTLTPKGEEEPVQALQEMIKAKTKQEKDFEVQLSEGDGLKLTFHKRAKEKERRQAETLEADKAAKIQQILAQSAAASTASSDESRPNSTLSTSQVSGQLPWQQPNSPYFFLSQTPDSLFMNGSPSAEAEMLMNQSLLEQGLMLQGRRRGRKRKEEKLAEIAMAEALARRQMARAVASFEPDSRVPVINLEDGSRLAGDKAPLKKDLDSWLDQHPGYIIDRIDDELEEGEIISDYSERRRGRKPKVDPAFLDVDKLTGEENVSVINRLTGKKITGAKAPPLRYLAEWLEQNPMWDVDPKWSDLVRAKGSLPKQLLPRVVTPNRRGRGRPARDSPPISHSMLGTSDPHAAAAMAATLEAMNAAQLMAAGFPKLPLPFASLPPGLGLTNPLLGLSGLGIPGLPTTPPLSSKDSDSKRKDLEDKEGSKGDSKSPHPSFPMMYNPLLYNPLLAAQGLGGFPLPTSLSSPGLSSRLINGHAQSDSEDEPKLSRSRRTSERVEQNEAEDLSVRSEKKVIENLHEAHSSGKHKPEPVMDDSEQPCDLSMKSKSKEEPGTKIIGSDKLSRIVDSLKDRVNKMDGKPVTNMSEKVKEVKKSKLDSLLFSLTSQEKPSDLSSPSFDRRPSLSSTSSSDRRSSLTSPTSDRRPNLTSLMLDRQSSSSERRPSSSDKQVAGSSERASTSKLLTSHSDTSLTRKSSLSSPISLTSSSGVKSSTKEPVPQIVQELLAAKQLKDAAKLQKEMDLAAKQQRAIEALVAKQRQMDEVFFMKRSSTDSKLLKDSKEKASMSERLEKEGSAGRSSTKEDKS